MKSKNWTITDGTTMAVYFRNGGHTLIDAADWERERTAYRKDGEAWVGKPSKQKWYRDKENYVRTNASINGKQANLSMHRLLIDVPAELQTDHINGDALDNRSANLRAVTCQQNHKAFRTPIGISKFRGVCWHKHKSKWHSQITVTGKIMHIGYFVSEHEAAASYNAAAIKHGFDKAALNTIP